MTYGSAARLVDILTCLRSRVAYCAFVTVLFTDIAGSTRLWDQEPVAMAAARRLQALVRPVS